MWSPKNHKNPPSLHPHPDPPTHRPPAVAGPAPRAVPSPAPSAEGVPGGAPRTGRWSRWSAGTARSSWEFWEKELLGFFGPVGSDVIFTTKMTGGIKKLDLMLTQ